MYICICGYIVAHFVIWNILWQNSVSRVWSPVSVPMGRKRSCGVADAPQHLVSKRGRLSFRPAPPPPDVALSEPLPGGLQGWLQARVRHADMQPCAAQRSAQERAATPSKREEERPRECGERSSGPRQKTGATTR